MCHDLKPSRMNNVKIFKINFVFFLKYSKILTSFVVNVDQINQMLIANDNMYTFNQRMKMLFVDVYFSSKDHVGYNYGCM